MTAPIRKAVFPIAGLGTRFLPATKASAKERCCPWSTSPDPVRGRGGLRRRHPPDDLRHRPHQAQRRGPFRHRLRARERTEAAGKTELLNVARLIAPADMNCVFVPSRALGLGHAVLCAKDLVGNEAFAVLLADDLMVGEPPVMAQMVQQFAEWRASLLAVQDARANTPGAMASSRAR